MSGKRLVKAAFAAIGVLTLCACGATATSGTPVGVDDEPVAVSLNAVEVDGIGMVLTDQDGMTLYRFDRDSADPPTSQCGGDCAEAWPPVVTEGDFVVAGFDRSRVATMPRVDGDRQVTVAGWPLYRFARDVEPGQANGHGADDAWYAVTPEGRKGNLTTLSGPC